MSAQPARFHKAGAIEIAVNNCKGLPTPVVVLGYRAVAFARFVPTDAKIVVNRNWRAGQLGSLLAGLQEVPREAPFLLYPVDHVFLTSGVIGRLLAAFRKRTSGQHIFMPRFRGRSGHPVIFSAAIRQELETAGTAREVVYRDERRICHVAVRTPAIWKDFEPANEVRHLRDSAKTRVK